MKVGPHLGDAICRATQLLIRSFARSVQKNIWNSRDEKAKGGGIRRAEVSVCFVFSGRYDFLPLLGCTHSCSHSPREDFTFDPENA